MDRISHLPDETLSKILSFLPTKDVMQTMLLAKRWKSVWLLVQRLEFDDSTHFPEPLYWGAPEPDYGIFRRFIDRSLISRERQVLKILNLKFRGRPKGGDTEFWVGTAVKRGLMELKIEYGYGGCVIPKSLYTCESLVVLKLENGILDVPDLVRLRSLKTLSLDSMSFSDATTLLRVLPNCPVLEDLFIKQSYYHKNALTFKIVVPSLKRLTLLYSSTHDEITELVLEAPFLKYLHIEVMLSRPEKLLHSLSSVENISFCLSASEVVYPVDYCFRRLKRLEVCTCKSEWLDLFMHLLQDSPSLQVIKIKMCKTHTVTNPRPQWNQPGSVPRCLTTNLETLEWKEYQGTQEEKELSTYILKTAVCLKKASFTTKYTSDLNKKLQMLQDLSLSRRGSTTCELTFK